MTTFDKIERLKCPSLQTIYELVKQIQSDDIKAADCRERGKRGGKVALTRIRVKLSKVANLCKEARKEILGMREDEGNNEMEKYGVDENASLSKQGDTIETCTQCGRDIETHGEIRKCPSCGTKPFE